jgi:hypothetical protein
MLFFRSGERTTFSIVLQNQRKDAEKEELKKFFIFV